MIYTHYSLHSCSQESKFSLNFYSLIFNFSFRLWYLLSSSTGVWVIISLISPGTISFTHYGIILKFFEPEFLYLKCQNNNNQFWSQNRMHYGKYNFLVHSRYCFVPESVTSVSSSFFYRIQLCSLSYLLFLWFMIPTSLYENFQIFLILTTFYPVSKFILSFFRHGTRTIPKSSDFLSTLVISFHFKVSQKESEVLLKLEGMKNYSLDLWLLLPCKSWSLMRTMSVRVHEYYLLNH